MCSIFLLTQVYVVNIPALLIFFLYKWEYTYIYMHICMCVCVYETQQLIYLTVFVGFPGGAVVKNPPGNEGVTGDVGSTPESGRSPGRGNGTHSSILACKMPWTEELVGYSPGDHRESDSAECTCVRAHTHTHTYTYTV